MKKQTTLIMAIAATAAIATIGTVALVKAPALNNFAQVKASTKSVTLNAEDLSKATFSDLDLAYDAKKQYDKQFQIPLENGNFINGALVFSDCGHQFVGNNLSEPFGLDNSEQGSSNAFNFNFMFSFEKSVTKIEVNYTAIGSEGVSFTYASRIRFSNEETDSTKFYDTLKTNWGDITDGSVNFFDRRDEESRSITSEASNVSASFECDGEHTIGNFNINTSGGNHLPGGQTVTFQLTSIEFTYECK